jgi:hypothetical protein
MAEKSIVKKKGEKIARPAGFINGDTLVITGDGLEQDDWRIITKIRICFSLKLANNQTEIPKLEEDLDLNTQNDRESDFADLFVRDGYYNGEWGEVGMIALRMGASVGKIEGNPFSCFKCLKSIDVDEENVCFASRDGVLYTKNMERLISFPRGKLQYSIRSRHIHLTEYLLLFRDVVPALEERGGYSDETVREIGEGAFSYCEGLCRVSLPMARVIGEDAFYGCADLVKAEFPCAETVGENAFGCCGSLAMLRLPSAIRMHASYDTFDSLCVIEFGAVIPAIIQGDFCFSEENEGAVRYIIVPENADLARLPEHLGWYQAKALKIPGGARASLSELSNGMPEVSAGKYRIVCPGRIRWHIRTIVSRMQSKSRRSSGLLAAVERLFRKKREKTGWFLENMDMLRDFFAPCAESSDGGIYVDFRVACNRPDLQDTYRLGLYCILKDLGERGEYYVASTGGAYMGIFSSDNFNEYKRLLGDFLGDFNRLRPDFFKGDRAEVSIGPAGEGEQIRSILANHGWTAGD